MLRRHILNSCLMSTVLSSFVCCSDRPADAGNWPAWRGPAGTSVSDETNLPLRWSDGDALRTELPEWGTSTPAIWKNALFITTTKADQLLLMRIDKNSGKIVWQRQVGTGALVRKVPGGGKRTSKFHKLHNLASPSPVTDGSRVIVHFGNGDLASYTFDGRREWKRNLADDYGKYTIWWGHANSPILFENYVISVCMQDSMEGDREKLSSSYLVAHNKKTGRREWITKRMTGGNAEECDAYTTPVLNRIGSRTEMLVMGGNQLDAYDPATGRQLWFLPGLVGGRTITGPTITNGIVYATVGMRGPLHAVTIGGQKKRTFDEAVEWKHTQATPDSCCPVVWKELLFLVTDSGVASCLDAKSGKVHWKKRLVGKNYKASPLAADGNIYFLSREGHCSIVRASAEFQLLAENNLDGEFLASPAISDGRIYFRGRKALFRVGK